jgi:hypothetical protein
LRKALKLLYGSGKPSAVPGPPKPIHILFHVAGHNSIPFFLASILAGPLSTMMLVGEMFHQDKKQLRLTVGSPIRRSIWA